MFSLTIDKLVIAEGETKTSHNVTPEELWQILVVDDSLPDGHHDPPGLLEELLSIPSRVQGMQLLFYSVVFPREDDVQGH